MPDKKAAGFTRRPLEPGCAGFVLFYKQKPISKSQFFIVYFLQ
jgi:hypothetical protein